jgi:hypothetical protein
LNLLGLADLRAGGGIITVRYVNALDVYLLPVPTAKKTWYSFALPYPGPFGNQ